MAWAGPGFGALLLAIGLIAPSVAPGQMMTAGAPASVLTLDQDRLYSETLLGKHLQAQFEATSGELAERNRQLTEELTAEERALTEKRRTVSPEEFREMADAFDQKVTKLRSEQDARIVALQRRRDLDRRVFTGRILPILSEIVRDSGAVAILDDRAVILSSESIDVTDEAIARIDALLGDGQADQPAEQESAEPATPE